MFFGDVQKELMDPNNQVGMNICKILGGKM